MERKGKERATRARYFADILLEKNGGNVARTAKGAAWVVGSLGARCVPRWNDPGGGAALIEDIRRGGWVIEFDAIAPEYEQIRQIYHEAVELLGRTVEPGFWDADLDIRSTGAGNADRERHLVAVRAVDILLPRLKPALPPRPQPFDWARYGQLRPEIERVPEDQFEDQEWPGYGRRAD